jgi:hypothetical protein
VEAAQGNIPGPRSVKNPSFAIGFSCVAEMALFQVGAPAVLEAAPEGNDP